MKQEFVGLSPTLAAIFESYLKQNLCYNILMPYKNREDQKAYQKEYHKRWYVKNKDNRQKQVAERRLVKKIEASELINKFKTSTGCKDCGYNAHSVALDFDHLNSKSYNISAMVADGYKTDAIQKEMLKCEVVCANCHRVRTKSRRDSV